MENAEVWADLASNLIEASARNIPNVKTALVNTINTYDILKYVAQIVLPAIATLYFALAGIWDFPYGEQIVGTITAVDTFLGVILGISTINYKSKEENK